MKNTAKNQSGNAKAWVVAFSILLYFCLLLVLILIPLKQTVLNADYFTVMFGEDDIDAIAPDVIAEILVTSFAKNPNGGLDAQFISILSQDQIEQFAAGIIPAGWTEEQIILIIKAAQDYLNLKSDSLSIRINLQPIKENLTSPAGRQTLLALFSSLPVCSFEQLALIMAAVQNGEGGLVLCYPAAVDSSLLDFLIQPVVESLSQKIPAEIIIPSGSQVEQWDYFTNLPAIFAVRRLLQIMQAAPWICLGLVLLIVCVSHRSLRWMMAGLGLPLVFAGMTAAFPGAWLYLFSDQLANRLVSRMNLVSWPKMTEWAGEMGRELLLSFGTSLLIWSFTALLIGLVLIGLRFLAKR